MRSKRKNTPWTDQEDEILLRQIRETPNNLTYSFDQVKIQLKGRSADAIGLRWYHVLKDNPNVGAIFGMITAKGAIANTKNMRRPEKKGSNWTMNVAEMAISKLTMKQRLEVIEKIMQMKHQ